jgi:hypothetical protein
LEKNLQSKALVGDFGGSCIHRSSRQREKAIEMLQFFRAVSALTVSMDLIDCFWRKVDVCQIAASAKCPTTEHVSGLGLMRHSGGFRG